MLFCGLVFFVFFPRGGVVVYFIHISSLYGMLFPNLSLFPVSKLLWHLQAERAAGT